MTIATDTSPKHAPTTMTAETLPLSVRECLMRGQYESAVNKLISEYGIDHQDASQLIEEYRSALRERKIALDIQMINEQQERETKEQLHIYFTWGVRITMFILTIALIYLITRVKTP